MKRRNPIVAVTLVLLLGAVGATWAEPVGEDPVETAWGSVLQWVNEVIALFLPANNTDEMNGFIDPGGSPNNNGGVSTTMPDRPIYPAS